MSDERERPTDDQRRALAKVLLGNGSAQSELAPARGSATCDHVTEWNQEGTKCVRKCGRKASWVNGEWYSGQVKALCLEHMLERKVSPNDELCGGASPSASASGSQSDFTKD